MLFVHYIIANVTIQAAIIYFSYFLFNLGQNLMCLKGIFGCKMRTKQKKLVFFPYFRLETKSLILNFIWPKLSWTVSCFRKVLIVSYFIRNWVIYKLAVCKSCEATSKGLDITHLLLYQEVNQMLPDCRLEVSPLSFRICCDDLGLNTEPSDF